MRIRKHCLIITLLCFSCLMNASGFMFKHLEVKEGLSNNQILDIFKDSEGFMWFATASGLNRYDGDRMTLFRSYNADPASLPDNYVESIQEDYKGNLWILTGAGYAIYSPESETFNRDVHEWLWEAGIDGTPALVHIDHYKNMWFYIKGKGCCLYMPESQLLYPLWFGTHQLPEGDITDIQECGEGVLLVYNTGRLVCLDSQTNKIKWQQDDLTRELGIEKQGIFTLFVDRDNDIWMYSPFGMWVYNPKQKKWLSQLADMTKYRSCNRVRAVAQDKQGRIWIGKDQEGIDILDKKTGEVRHLLNKADDERSLQDNTVMALYEDSSETMWVGTYKKGVSYFNESTFKFGIEHIGNINCIEEDKEGCVWLGTNDAGVIYWNSATGSRSAFPQNTTDKLITDAIVCILKTDDGKLWMGTLGKGLICYDNGRVTRYKKNMPEQQNSLAHNHVCALAEDKQGTIWIGTLGGGVQSLDLKTGLFTTYNTSSAGLLSDDVFSLCMGKEGSLWIGTDQGLSELDLETKKVASLKGTKSGKEYFSDQHISQVYEDSRGLLWIGTREGLNVYNPQMDELIVLGVEQGVSSPVISGIVEDDHKNIWVTTARGITNIIPAEDSKTGGYTFRNYIYDDKDGLQNCGFNQRSIKKLSSGEIVMGGLYGVNRFRPDDIKYNKKCPKVMFTRLFLFNEEVKVGKEYEGRIILDKVLNKVDQIKLSYEQNMFSVQFASDNYILPEKTEYVYKLEGFNDGWLTTAYGEVTYTNLSPGTYMLKVKAINGDGYGGGEEASLKIVVYPPFWLSVWAYVIYGCLAVAVLLLGRYLFPNAFKFTRSGGRVDVFVGLAEGQESQEMLEVRVADTGVGISEEDKERVFERFYQVDNPDIELSGSGIGLTIARDFVKLHGGTVKVMDNVPAGCVFVVHIPVKCSGSKPAEAEQAQVAGSLVEDVSTLQVPEPHAAPDAGAEPEEESNHIITIEGLEEDIRRLESDNAEEIVEERNIETISTIAPQRATVIQLVEGEDNEIITQIVPPEELPETVTAVSGGRKGTASFSLDAEEKLNSLRDHVLIDPIAREVAITSMDEKLIDHAVKYVEENMARSDLSVEELSRELGMSRVHLYKKLLAVTGKTPIEFIRVIRLKRAAWLLRESQQNISEIAYQVGFNNPKYFSKYFKEEFGMLPSAYQCKEDG